MSRQRWTLGLILIFSVVLAACQPAATPTPTARPAPTTAPPTEAATEETVIEAATETVGEATEVATDEEIATEAATEEMVATESATEEMTATEEATMEATEMATVEVEVGNVIEVAAQAGDFSTLLAAIDAAGLTETLEGDGPFTIFAPTDDAFQALLDENSMDADAMLAREDLADILKYHVVAGAVTSDELESYRSTDNPDEIIVPTLLEGENLVITFDGDKVIINGTAEVTLSNVEASNGVIHVIDTVLMPAVEEVATEEPTEEMVATEAATEEVSTPEPTEAPVAEATEEGATDIAAGSTVTVEAGGDVVIGLAVGLSGEGIAPLGTDIQRGAELALEDRAIIIVGGREFNVSLDVQDDLCSADGGQAVGNRFAADSSIVGVVGPMCSSACLAAAPIFDAADFTTISPSCTGALLSTSGFTSFNRAAVSDVFQGRIAAQFIYDVLGARNIATIHDGSAYGEGLVGVVEDAFTALGGEIASSDAVQVGDTDFRGLLDDVAQNDPDLIYFVGFPAEGARLIQQREDAGLEDVTFMSADGVYGTEVINLSGESAEGVYATSGIPTSSDAMNDFLTRYVETYGEEPPAPYHANGYDAINILLDAIEAVGTVDADGNLVVSRDDLQSYVRSVSGFEGLTGTLSNDGTGELFTFGEFGISEVQNGAFTPIYTGTVRDGEVTLTEATAEPVVDAPADATEETSDDAEATEEAPADDEATPEATEAA